MQFVFFFNQCSSRLMHGKYNAILVLYACVQARKTHKEGHKRIIPLFVKLSSIQETIYFWHYDHTHRFLSLRVGKYRFSIASLASTGRSTQIQVPVCNALYEWDLIYFESYVMSFDVLFLQYECFCPCRSLFS